MGERWLYSYGSVEGIAVGFCESTKGESFFYSWEYISLWRTLLQGLGQLISLLGHRVVNIRLSYQKKARGTIQVVKILTNWPVMFISI
jgi:hypothetical protein